ncbi:MAG: hypothetical protein OXH68_20905 [Gammaproteobacteria bacterium]|nr:hypothetical protein [Gammaproteobacteria bacterium]
MKTATSHAGDHDARHRKDRAKVALDQLFAVALAEWRQLWRSRGTWLVAVLTVAAGLGAYLYLAYLHATFSFFSSTSGFISPRFLIHHFGAVPLCILMLGVALLGFDSRRRDVRDQFAEVLDCRPLSNLAIIVGRFFGTFIAAWLIVAVTLGLLQVTGIAAPALGLPFGEAIEPASLATFLLVDSSVALVVWCTVVQLATFALRSPTAVLLATFALVAGLYWLLHHTPVHLIPAISPLPSFGVFASDILPTFASGLVLLQRGLFLLIAVACIVAASALFPRFDDTRGVAAALIGTTAILAATAGLSAFAYRSFDPMALREQWRLAHSTHVDAPRADVEWITGRVHVAPDVSLTLDLEIGLTAPTNRPVDTLVFTLNPAMAVHELRVAGAAARFRQQSGLLFVQLRQPIPTAGRFTLAIVAKGVPNPGFAYLDAHSEPRKDSWADGQLSFLGTEASLFDKAYVALMPGTGWLPLPGPHLTAGAKQQPRDFFVVDLTVEVPTGWEVAGPGRTHRVPGEGRRFRFQPGAPLHEVAILAAPFERYEVEQGGVTFALLMHRDHVANASLFSGASGRISEHLQRLLDQARALGIPYPYNGLTVAEVPAKLRVFRGGWSMGTAQSFPGLLLMREHGFPTARFDRHFASFEAADASDADLSLWKVSAAEGYFRRDQTGGNILASAADQLIGFTTAPHGEHALSTQFLIERLAAGLLKSDQTLFSAHAYRQSPLAAAGPNIAAMGLPEIASPLAALALPNVHRILGAARSDLDSAAVWTLAADATWAELQQSGSPHLALATMSAKSRVTALALIDSLGIDAVGQILAELRRRYADRTYSYADLVALAEELGMALGPVAERLHGRSLPGFHASSASVTRLDQREQRTPAYQIRLDVRNGEAAPGIIRVDVGTDAGRGAFLDWESTAPIAVPGRSSVEVGILSSKPPLDLWLVSYLSLNGMDLRIPLSSMQYPDAGDAAPFAGGRPSAWRPIETGIVVDDLDSGFAIRQLGTVLRGLEGLRSFLNPTGVGDHQDLQIPVYRQISAHPTASPPSAFLGANWSRQEVGGAWGKYRRTVARCVAGDGTKEVTFSADLPAAGRWRLEYHLPDLTQRPRFKTFADTREAFGTWHGGRLGIQHLSLVAGGKATPLELDAGRAGAGWHIIGTFALEPGEVELVVSNRTSGQTVIADAVRWSLVDDR